MPPPPGPAMKGRRGKYAEIYPHCFACFWAKSGFSEINSTQIKVDLKISLIDFLN